MSEHNPSFQSADDRFKPLNTSELRDITGGKVREAASTIECANNLHLLILA